MELNNMARKSEFTEKVDNVIGRKIHELRLAKGLSRQQLSAKIGVTHQQLQKYEKGTNRISAGRLMSIANALGRKVQFFFEDVEDFAPSYNSHERLGIELSRIFLNIKDVKQQIALVALARTLH